MVLVHRDDGCLRFTAPITVRFIAQTGVENLSMWNSQCNGQEIEL
jgi:hypothetical protein